MAERLVHYIILSVELSWAGLWPDRMTGCAVRTDVLTHDVQYVMQWSYMCVVDLVVMICMICRFGGELMTGVPVNYQRAETQLSVGRTMPATHTTAHTEWHMVCVQVTGTCTVCIDMGRIRCVIPPVSRLSVGRVV